MSPMGRRAARVLAAAIGTTALVVAVLVWSRTGSDTSREAEAVRIEHVHGLGVNPADGRVYAAAHNGLFRLSADAPAVPAGAGVQDTMGFTVVGPNRFLASGHPAAPEPGEPRHLGLMESVDAGASWQTLSLSGAADFHVLRFRHDTVYGYNSVSQQLMVSRDRTVWQSRSTLDLRDFVVSPASSETLLATTQSGLQRSADGGRTWASADGPSLLLLDWQDSGRLWAVATSGDVLRSDDGGAAWTKAGRTPASATAFAAYEGDLYVATHEQGILHSGDSGITWTPLHP